MKEQMISGIHCFIVDGKTFSYKELEKMDFENLKVLASFCTTTEQLKTLAFHANNIQFEMYVENLINRLYE